MEEISWTDHVRNEEVLLRVNEQRNILHDLCILGKIIAPYYCSMIR